MPEARPSEVTKNQMEGQMAIKWLENLKEGEEFRYHRDRGEYFLRTSTNRMYPNRITFYPGAFRTSIEAVVADINEGLAGGTPLEIVQVKDNAQRTLLFCPDGTTLIHDTAGINTDFASGRLPNHFIKFVVRRWC